jgi:hypothetical protein
MIPLQNAKVLLYTANLATADVAWTSGAIDLLGVDQATVFLQIGNQASSSGNAITVLSLTEGTNTYSSNASAIAALTGGTAGAAATTDGFLIPTPQSTAAPQIVMLNINTKQRERYLFAQYTSAGAANLTGVGVLAVGGRSGEAPVGTTSQNVTLVKNV